MSFFGLKSIASALAAVIVVALAVPASPVAAAQSAAIAAKPALAGPNLAVALDPGELPTDGWVTRTDGVEGRVVSQANPRVDAHVWDIEMIGDTTFVAGKFTTVVRATDQWQREAQPFVAAFETSTGKFVSGWRPTLDGPVWALDELPDGNLLVGGEFQTVNGAARSSLVALDVNTGATVPSFSATVTRPWSDNLPVVRDTFIQGNNLYVIGNFGRVIGNGVTMSSAAKVARLNAANGEPDLAWVPVLAGKSGWSVVATDDGQTVHLGGEFATVNGAAGTNTYAVVDGTTGALVPGATHGLPVPAHPVWPVGGIVYDLAIEGNIVYLAGAEHFYQLRDASNGANINLVTDWAGRTTFFNDTQVIEVLGDTLYVGCHCARHWGFQNMDANPLTGVQFNALTDYTGGGDGVWAEALADDGCIWMGGQILNSTRIVGRADGTSGWVGSIARFCGEDGPPPPPVEEFSYIDSGADWRVSTEASWPNGWTETGFDDAGWTAATTQMGYGDGDEATVLDNQNRQAAPLARSTFEVADPAQLTHLRLRVVADDGVTVWINGQPRLAHRIDEGTLVPSTLSNFTAWGAAERDFTEFAIDADGLVAGTNTIAVSIHQAWPNSSDLSMDLELVGSTLAPPALIPRPNLSVVNVVDEVQLRGSDEAFRFSTNPADGWTAAGFDDAAWTAGTGVAGFGEPDIDTDLGVGNISYAWRTTFELADPNLSAATAYIKRDDGIAVWINGQLVGVDNLDEPPTFGALATAFVWGAGENTAIPIQIDPQLLVAGTNTIAISIHQAHPDSGDLRLAVDVKGVR